MKKLNLITSLLMCFSVFNVDCFSAKKMSSLERRDVLRVVDVDFDVDFDNNEDNNYVFRSSYEIGGKKHKYKLTVGYTINWNQSINSGWVVAQYKIVKDTKEIELTSGDAVIIPNHKHKGHSLVAKKDFWTGDKERCKKWLEGNKIDVTDADLDAMLSDIGKHKSNLIGAIRKTFIEQILPKLNNSKASAPVSDEDPGNNPN